MFTIIVKSKCVKAVNESPFSRLAIFAVFSFVFIRNNKSCRDLRKFEKL